jgi:hypothetical protein
MDKVFSNKDLRAFLNNAVIATKAQHGFNADGLSPGRRQALRNYAGAMLSPVIADIDKEYLSEQEATYLLSLAAVFISKRYLANKMPVDEEADMVYGQNEYLEILPNMLCVECGCRLGVEVKDKKLVKIAKKRGRPRSKTYDN